MRFGARGELHIIVHVTCTLFHFGAWSLRWSAAFQRSGYILPGKPTGIWWRAKNVLDGVRGGGEAGPDVPSN